MNDTTKQITYLLREPKNSERGMTIDELATAIGTSTLVISDALGRLNAKNKLRQRYVGSPQFFDIYYTLVECSKSPFFG